VVCGYLGCILFPQNFKDNLSDNRGEFELEFYINFWEALLMMGAIVPLFLRVKLKKEKPLQSLEKAIPWHNRMEHIREKGL